MFASFSSLTPRFLGSWYAPLAFHCPLSVEDGSKSGWDLHDLELSQRFWSGQSSTLFQKCFCKSSSLIGLIIKEIKTSQNHLFLLPQALLRPSAHHHFRSSGRWMGDGWRLWSLSRGPNCYLWRPFTGRENLWAEKLPKPTNADQLRGNSYFNVLVGVMLVFGLAVNTWLFGEWIESTVAYSFQGQHWVFSKGFEPLPFCENLRDLRDHSSETQLRNFGMFVIDLYGVLHLGISWLGWRLCQLTSRQSPRLLNKTSWKSKAMKSAISSNLIDCFGWCFVAFGIST